MAKQANFVDLEKKVAKCAMQDKTVAMLDRLEAMIDNMTRRVNADFVTKDAINK